MNTPTTTNQPETIQQNQPTDATVAAQGQVLPPAPEKAIVAGGSPEPLSNPALELATTATEVASPQPPQRPPHSRNGRIARLPSLALEMVNQMLRNNIPYVRIVNALDELDIQVTERNISNWKTRGGHRDWCREQDCANRLRVHQDNILQYLRKHDASQLPEIGLQVAATELSDFLLTPDAAKQLASEPAKFDRHVSVLCRLAAQLHTLQKYRDDSARKTGYLNDPERVRREKENEAESVREIYTSETCTGPRDPIVHHRNFIPKQLD
jgi:hypothetical protein